MASFLGYFRVEYPTTAMIVISTGVYLLYVVVRNVRAYFSAPIRDLPGPKSINWLTGSLPGHVWELDAEDYQLEWTRRYGPNLRYYGWFNTIKVLTTDPQALNYILNSYKFEKPEHARLFLGDILGKGLFFAEGQKHKQQRKFISPAFGLPQIKVFSQFFVEKANELRDALITEVAQSSQSDGSLRLDAVLWLNRITLDMIGQAGFDHSFGSLHQEESYEIAKGFLKASMYNPFSVKLMLPVLFPPARLIPTERSRTLFSSFKAIQAIGRRMISQKKSEILASTGDETKGDVRKKDIQGRDLLSLLIKANMATDIPDSARMSDEDILAQIPTFIFAGHESTSVAVTWSLYALGCNPIVHAKLNAEARAFHTDTPSMDELNGMTYLDYFIREALRLYTPVARTERVAQEDTVVPVSEPYVDRHGIKRHEIRLRKGDTVFIPIRAMNRLKSLWGEDADEFRPERWEAVPEAVKSLPSVFSNLLTFIAGTHACVGYRFSIAEMKALIFSFTRAFDFELAVPPNEVTCRTMIATRPYLVSNAAEGSQLPIIIRLAKSE